MKIKCTLVLLLVLLIVFSLAACSITRDNTDPSFKDSQSSTEEAASGNTGSPSVEESKSGEEETPSNVDIENLQPVLEAALAKVSNASSYTLTIVDTDDDLECDYNAVTTVQVTKGANASLLYESVEEWTDHTDDGDETGTGAHYQLYFQGTTGYEQNTSLRNYKYYLDTEMTVDRLLLHQDGFSIRNTEALFQFAELGPVATENEDGSVTYALNNTTIENFLSVYLLLSSGDEEEKEETAQWYEQVCADDTVLNILVSIDAQGCFSMLYFEMIDMVDDEYVWSETSRYTITEVNTTEVSVPDFAENFTYGRWGCAVIVNDDAYAYYLYEEEYFRFQGFGTYARDDYTVSCYKLCTEIEGVPVAGGNAALYNTFCDVTVERLVIPSGLHFTYTGSYLGDTILFFEDTMEERFDPELYDVAAGVYYGGQWEYVDGIPSPIG